MRKFKLAFLALAAVSGIAAAATQGTLGSTSTGSFTNTFNSTPRQVQVLGLSDAAMNPNSANVDSAWGSFPGATDKFCVVDTGGGAVKLTFTGAHGVGSNPSMWKSVAADGSVLEYAFSVGQPNVGWAQSNLDTTGITVTAGGAATSASGCGAGNMIKSMILNGGASLPVGTKVFTDTMTVVATPV